LLIEEFENVIFPSTDSRRQNCVHHPGFCPLADKFSGDAAWPASRAPQP
jgi:hypothetical protein